MNRKGLTKSVLFLMVWPIVVELVVNGLIGNFNQIIINEFSTDAVATIGSGAQILTVIINIYSIISVGLSILLAQVVGAKRYQECSKIINTALLMNFILGIVISLVGVLCIPWMLHVIHMPKELETLAKQYLVISVGLSFVQAILNTLTAVFRSFGYMKKVTITLICVNLTCLLLNILISICIPVSSQNLMQYAMTGIIAQSIGVFIFFHMLLRDKLIPYTFSIREGILNSKKVIVRILRLGVPGGLEGIIYLISQTIIVGFIGVLGTQAMFTKAIVGNVTYYMSMATTTISTAAGVIIGQLIGAGKIEEVRKSCKKNIKLTLGITIPLCLILVIFGKGILSIYTKDTVILRIGMQLLIVNSILEVARCVAGNMVVTLKAVGDVDFPFIIIIFASMINIIISYYFGIHMKMGLVGIWIGYIADLALRGAACLIQWNRGKWEKYALYYTGEEKDEIEYIS